MYRAWFAGPTSTLAESRTEVTSRQEWKSEPVCRPTQSRPSGPRLAICHRRSATAADGARCTDTWLVEQPVEPLIDESCSPLAHGWPCNSESASDAAVGETARRAQHDPRTQGERLGGLAPSGPLPESRSFLIAENERSKRSALLHVAVFGSCIIPSFAVDWEQCNRRAYDIRA